MFFNLKEKKSYNFVNWYCCGGLKLDGCIVGIGVIVIEMLSNLKIVVKV